MRLLVVAAVAVALCALLVLSVAPSHDQVPTELEDYNVWLNHFGSSSREFTSDKGNRKSLKKIHQMLQKASSQLSTEIDSLRKLQEQNKAAVAAAPSIGGEGPESSSSSSSSSAHKSSMPKDFSANAIADALSSKLEAYEKVREKAARYLLKDIAKTIVGSLDKGKISLKDSKKEKEAKLEEAEEASSRKVKEERTSAGRRDVRRESREDRAERRRERRARRREERHERREEREHLERVLQMHHPAPNTESHDKKYEVNKGRYVVVINQRNVDGRVGTMEVSKKADRTVKEPTKKAKRSESDGDGGEDGEDGGEDNSGDSRRSSSSSSGKKKPKVSSKDAAKFKPQDEVDRRLSRIAKIAMDSVRRLRMQRRQLREMRRARRRIIKEVTRRRRHEHWKKEIHIQSPVIVMSRDGSVVSTADAAIKAANKASKVGEQANKKASDITKTANNAQASAHAASTAAAKAGKTASNGKTSSNKAESSAAATEAKKSEQSQSAVNSFAGDIHVNGPMVVINAAKKKGGPKNK